MMIPPLVVVERAATPGHRARWREALSERRGSQVEVREPERGDKRRILELAQRNARLALDQEKLRSERRRQQRTEALDGLQQALGLDTLPLRIECYDISTLMGTNTVASMVVFEGAAPKKSDYRRFKVRTVGDAAADAGRSPAQHLERNERRVRARRLRLDGGDPRAADGAVRGAAATARRTTRTTTRASRRCRT